MKKMAKRFLFGVLLMTVGWVGLASAELPDGYPVEFVDMDIIKATPSCLLIRVTTDAPAKLGVFYAFQSQNPDPNWVGLLTPYVCATRTPCGEYSVLRAIQNLKPGGVYLLNAFVDGYYVDPLDQRMSFTMPAAPHGYKPPALPQGIWPLPDKCKDWVPCLPNDTNKWCR
jgi:hypothetical protein